MRVCTLCVSLLALIAPAIARTQTAAKPWPIRAVIVTTFEIGNDTGDIPGEFQFWVEREHLDEVLDFPGGPNLPAGQHPLRTNKDHTVLGIISGTTLVNSTASMMALGLDPRFDLTHAYFLINGIAGVDPHVASMGSAAWAHYVLNDVSRYLDPRDAPADWPYGFFPNSGNPKLIPPAIASANAANPLEVPTSSWMRSNLYTLNPKLAAWAFAQTRSLNLGDDPKVAAFRAGFTGFPEAQKPPFVLMGDTFASDDYWHGAVMTKFAEDWVRLYTQGKGTFAMTEMEDSGFMNALERLSAMHRVDVDRVMVLRTASNYSMPRPGHNAVESLTAPYIGSRLALESAWLCGSTVLHNILGHWETTYAHIPGD